MLGGKCNYHHLLRRDTGYTSSTSFSFQYSFHHSSEYTFGICRFLIFDYDTASTRLIEMDILLPQKNVIWKDLSSFSFMNFSARLYCTSLCMQHFLICLSSALLWHSISVGKKLFIYFYFLSEFVKVSCHSFNTNNDKTDKRKNMQHQAFRTIVCNNYYYVVDVLKFKTLFWILLSLFRCSKSSASFLNAYFKRIGWINDLLTQL